MADGSAISSQVYAELQSSGYLSDRRQQVYAMLSLHGRMTCGEIYEHMKLIPGVKLKANANVIARCLELHEMGMVRKVGTKECESTGKTVTVWEAVDNAVPKPIQKKLTHKQQIAQLEARIKTLESQLQTCQCEGHDRVEA